MRTLTTVDLDRRHYQPGNDLPRPAKRGWRLLRALLVGVTTFCIQPGVTVVSAESQLDAESVILRADEAREDVSQQAIHLRGGVEVDASDWAIAADSASLYGDLEDPRLIVVKGMPARLRVFRSDGEDTVEAEGQHIEYRRAEDLIRITNRAILVIGPRTLRGSNVEYAIRTRRFTAGGGGERVRVESIPEP